MTSPATHQHHVVTYLPQRPWLLTATLAWLACGLATPATAQVTPPRPLTTIQHRISQGDTLQHLALRYLGDANLWPALQSHNSVASPYRLQPGKVLEIPLQLMRAATASVDYIHGQAALQRQGTTSPVARQMPLQEGDVLQLDPQAFVTVKLADGSTVRVQAASQVVLSQLRRRGRAGSLQSVLEVQQGGVQVDVPGKADPQRRLDVLTPVASTSVRGTSFDVQWGSRGMTSAVLQGQVAVHAAHNTTAVPAGMGMAVSAQGQASAPSALLPAPATGAFPTLLEDAQWLDIPLPQVPAAQTWQVTVSADSAGHHVLRNGQFEGPLARFAALEDGAYVLHLRAMDGQGISGYPASAPLRIKAHPVPPLVQSPAPQVVVAQGEGQLLCTPVHGVHSYRHQVLAWSQPALAPSASAWASAALQATTNNCTLDLSPLPAGDYVWRAASVRSVQGQDDAGPFATAYPLRIAPKPAALSLDAMQVQTQAGISTIHWSAEPGQRFRLQALDAPDAAAPALDTVLDQPSWTATGLPAGTWHIRIQVQDASGLHSAFSPPRSVQVRALVQDGFGNPISSGTGLGIERP